VRIGEDAGPMKVSVLIPTTGDIATVREHAALADQLGYDSANCSHIAARDYDAAADVAARPAAIGDAFIEDLCAIGEPRDVAAGVARYRAAGATNPMITNIPGTDLRPTLQAAIAAQRPPSTRHPRQPQPPGPRSRPRGR
jgi:hypothetical protein